MKMRVSRLMLGPALLLVAGCLQGERVVKVNADGSGTVVDTFKQEPPQDMLSMMEAMHKTAEAAEKAQKQRGLQGAAAMGKGVTHVSTVNTKGGAEQITYAFKDVSTIKTDFTAPLPGRSSDNRKEVLTFYLEPHVTSILVRIGWGEGPLDLARYNIYNGGQRWCGISLVCIAHRVLDPRRRLMSGDGGSGGSVTCAATFAMSLTSCLTGALPSSRVEEEEPPPS